MKYEYSHQYIDSIHDLKELNELGSQGWEIIHVFERGCVYRGEFKTKVICKRAVN